MKTTELISLAGFGDAQLSATNDARRERDALLSVASAIVEVHDLESANAAAKALGDLKGFTRQIEEARALVKAPVLDLGKRIDGLARELTSELDAEAARIGRTLGAWQAEERRKEEEAQRKARDEERRIWLEAQEKERLERERLAKLEREKAAAARAEEEKAKAAIASAKSEEDRLALEAQAEERRIALQIEEDERKAAADAEIERRRQEAGEKMVAARVEGNQVVAKRPPGVATREDVVFEVEDVTALHAAYPYLVTLEPNKAAIKSVLKNLKPDEKIPGIKWWREAKTHVR